MISKKAQTHFWPNWVSKQYVMLVFNIKPVSSDGRYISNTATGIERIFPSQSLLAYVSHTDRDQ